MKMRVQILIEFDDGKPEVVEEVLCVQRGALQAETLGLTLAEGKDLLRGVQQAFVPRQVEGYVEQQKFCADCGRPRPYKGLHQIVWRSLFGKLQLTSPRLYICPCRSGHTYDVKPCHSESPLAAVLLERTSPELRYLEAKAAAELSSYGRAVSWLQETLPLEGQISTTSLQRHVAEVAERLESEVSDDEPTIEGCPREWAQLPDPDGPLTVGLDGGYVHARPGECRQSTSFEIIVGKSVTAEGKAKCFGFVMGYDKKARSRLAGVLQSQGMQLNQQVTFLSDGGDTVRDLPLYLNPQAEHLLDWFHVTMRLTTMRQSAKGVRSRDNPEWYDGCDRQHFVEHSENIRVFDSICPSAIPPTF